MSTTMTIDAREHYAARDYNSVVALLGEIPRRQLLQKPEQAFLLVDSARRVGGIPDALSLAGEVVEAARGSEPRLLCDALNLHGVLLLEGGHAHAAQRAWSELVNVASESDIPEYVARASNNLGVAAVLGMRLEEAIMSFQRSVAAYVRLAYPRGLAQSYQNLGIVYREMDHEDESHAHFQRAITWAYAANCLDDVARAEQELALLLLYSGNQVAAAMKSAQKALDRFTELGQPGALAEAQRVVGVVAIANREHARAQTELGEALVTARSQQLRLLEAETLLAMAQLAPPAARVTHKQQAAAIFAEIGAGAWGEQVRKRMEAL
jgi:tetratricopeptide (TPR) repeat protein